LTRSLTDHGDVVGTARGCNFTATLLVLLQLAVLTLLLARAAKGFDLSETRLVSEQGVHRDGFHSLDEPKPHQGAAAGGSVYISHTAISSDSSPRRQG
jgi:hypothetical protein